MSQIAENLEFSRFINIADIPPTGHGFSVKATTDECVALCARFDLARVKCFEVSGTLKPVGKQRFILNAKLEAEIIQTCVITLDPIDARIAEAFEIILMAGDVNHQEDVDETDQFDPYEADPPLVFGDEKIDYGECAMQYFTDCLEPYPRKPGAAFDDITPEPDEIEQEKRDNPFKVLQKLK